MRIIILLKQHNYIVSVKLDGKQPQISTDVKVHNMIKLSAIFTVHLLAIFK